MNPPAGVEANPQGAVEAWWGPVEQTTTTPPRVPNTPDPTNNPHRRKPWIMCEAADCGELATRIVHFDDTSFVWCDHHV